jgi:hypothetical protein
MNAILGGTLDVDNGVDNKDGVWPTGSQPDSIDSEFHLPDG